MIIRLYGLEPVRTRAYMTSRLRHGLGKVPDKQISAWTLTHGVLGMFVTSKLPQSLFLAEDKQLLRCKGLMPYALLSGLTGRGGGLQGILSDEYADAQGLFCAALLGKSGGGGTAVSGETVGSLKK